MFLSELRVKCMVDTDRVKMNVCAYVWYCVVWFCRVTLS